MPALLLALDQAVRRGWIMHPDERAARQGQRTRTSRTAPEPAVAPAPYSGQIPELDADGQAEVREIVAALARAGMFAPEQPDPAFAYPHMADSLAHGAQEITVEDVLHALVDPREWLGDVDPARWSDRFVLHETQVEQPADYLVEQVQDLARISMGALTVENIEVTEGEMGANRSVPVTMRLTLNGEPQEWHWLGHAKYLSTVLHGHMARALEAAGTGRRFAAFFLDQGFIFACLEDGALIQLEGLPSWGHDWFGDESVVQAGSING